MQSKRTFLFLQKDIPVALLEHFNETNTNRIYINRLIPMNILPATFKVCAMGGMYDLDEEMSLYTIQERVPPPGRQNIDSILWDLGIPEYDEFKIMLAIKGRCCQDDCIVEEITSKIDFEDNAEQIFSRYLK